VNWNSAADFFAMGGYGTYVWGAYAVTLACMAVEPVLVVAATMIAPAKHCRNCNARWRGVQRTS
jgi:heme exporter protein D